MVAYKNTHITFMKIKLSNLFTQRYKTFFKSKNRTEFFCMVVLFLINLIFSISVELPAYLFPFQNLLGRFFLPWALIIIFGLYFFYDLHLKIIKNLHYLLVFALTSNNILFIILPKADITSFYVSCTFILSVSLIFEYIISSNDYFKSLSPLASLDFKSSLYETGKLIVKILCAIGMLYLFNSFLIDLSLEAYLAFLLIILVSFGCFCAYT